MDILSIERRAVEAHFGAPFNKSNPDHLAYLAGFRDARQPLSDALAAQGLSIEAEVDALVHQHRTNAALTATFDIYGLLLKATADGPVSHDDIKNVFSPNKTNRAEN